MSTARFSDLSHVLLAHLKREAHSFYCISPGCNKQPHAEGKNIKWLCVCVCGEYAVDKSEKQRLQASSRGVPLTRSREKSIDDINVLLRQRVYKVIQAAA